MRQHRHGEGGGDEEQRSVFARAQVCPRTEEGGRGGICAERPTIMNTNYADINAQPPERRSAEWVCQRARAHTLMNNNETHQHQDEHKGNVRLEKG